MRRGRMLENTLLGVICGFLSACAECYPPAPPLVRDTTTSGHWWTNGCPPPEGFAKHYRSGDELVSPEIIQRLRARFPPGSDATALERYLQAEGFQISSPCVEVAPRVRQAQFHQENCPWPINAKIAWELATDGTVAWTKGRVTLKFP